MTNILFRQRLISAICNAERAFTDVRQLDHAGMRGRVREIALEHLLRPVLPAPFELGTGKIIDSQGEQSRETDIVVFNREVLPPVMYSQRDGLFPIEASFFAIEVKSCITSAELDDAIGKSRRLSELTFVYGFHTTDAQQVEHPVMAVIPVLFAFASDLQPGGKDELQRYMERDTNWASTPAIHAICVLGRGLWHFSEREVRWYFHPTSAEHDEVIEWLSGIANSVHWSRLTRGYPRLGSYLMLRREIKFVDGNRVSAPGIE